jgi:16S rRNA processing protein RimM
MQARDQLFELGKVIRISGVKGEIEVYLDTDNPGNYKKLESVLLEINNELVPFFISGIRVKNRIARIKFEGTDSVDDALQLVNCVVFLPLDQLPGLEGKRFYFHEIKGCSVVDSRLGLLGELSQIYEMDLQPLAGISIKGKEILFPLLEAFIEKLDKENRILYVNLPEGLVDIYLEGK